MKTGTYYIIDFDSTFVKVEALDLLAEIALKNDPGRKVKLEKIKSLTGQAMEGRITFAESLKRRIALIECGRPDIEVLVKRLKKEVTRSILNNAEFFRQNSDEVIIISGGFKEYIIPVAEKFGIKSGNVYANSFLFDKSGKITGYDTSNCLCKANGKVKQLKALKLKGKLVVIGDGHTDYELKKSGIIDKFYAFTENIERESVIKKADHITPSFDEFLYVSRLPMSISYPKNRIKVLLLENIHKDASAIFKAEGYRVETVSGSMEEDQLAEKLRDVSILGIRSKTVVSGKVLAKAKKLIAVGAFCVGTNQIDLDACSRRGIIAFNAPFSNTRSVVELVIGEMILLMRGIIDKSKSLHEGVWDKSSKDSFEIRGKKLGIIGYGKIGSQLSVLAEDMGMEVYYYDVLEKLALGNARKCHTMKELLKK